METLRSKGPSSRPRWQWPPKRDTEGTPGEVTGSTSALLCICGGPQHEADRALPSFVKKKLHLHKSAPISFLYTKTRDGGLGLPCIYKRVMMFLRGQLRKLRTWSDLWIIALAQTQLIQRLQHRIKKFNDRNWQQEFSQT